MCKYFATKTSVCIFTQPLKMGILALHNFNKVVSHFLVFCSVLLWCFNIASTICCLSTAVNHLTKHLIVSRRSVTLNTTQSHRWGRGRKQKVVNRWQNYVHVTRWKDAKLRALSWTGWRRNILHINVYEASVLRDKGFL